MTETDARFIKRREMSKHLELTVHNLRPWCAVCERPADKVYVTHDGLYAFQVSIRCHRAVEIRSEDAEAMYAPDWKPEPAFVDAALYL